MRIISSALLLMIGMPCAAISYAQAAQSTPATGSAQTIAPAQTATPVATTSSLLQPALTRTQTTLSSLRIDKWKKGSVRDEAAQNVQALLHDLQSNIPPLMAAADAEPGALSRGIPLLKHLDAFYDVLLRVEEASRVSGPGEQVTALQETLLDVNKARMALDDQMTSSAANQEKQMFALQSELRAREESPHTTATATSTVPCKPATPVHKKKRTTTGSQSTSTKPSAAKPAEPPPQ
jgi:hypothetical protein